MVRTMPRFPFHRIAVLPPSITLFIVVIAVLFALSLVTLLCGSEKAAKSQRRREEKTVRLGGNKKAVARLQSNLSGKALLLAKMISWRKVHDEVEDEENDDEEAVWRKTIIRGEKCRPLDFSGKILYDSEGNLPNKVCHEGSWPRDELVWHYTTDGVFTVKSAYHLAMNLKRLETNEGSASTGSSQKLFWQKLWKMEIPPRIKIFLWKACSRILPTGQNLRHRMKAVHGGCLFCGCDLETDKHILFECAAAKQTWKEFAVIKDPHCSKAINFQEWLATIMDSEAKEITEQASTIAWLIWKNRNAMVFEGIIREAKLTVHYAQILIREFQAAQSKKQPVINAAVDRWATPEAHLLKLNVDAALCNHRAGAGVIVRNSEGEVQAVMLENLNQCMDSEHAETMAFLQALSWAKDVGLTHFILEGDALNVVKKINSSQKLLSMTGHIVEAIRDLLRKFPEVHIQYAPRRCNRAAHLAAKLALNVSSRVEFFSDFPEIVMNSVTLDLC